MTIHLLREGGKPPKNEDVGAANVLENVNAGNIQKQEFHMKFKLQFLKS
jgi:hypothetical protein